MAKGLAPVVPGMDDFKSKMAATGVGGVVADVLASKKRIEGERPAQLDKIALAGAWEDIKKTENEAAGRFAFKKTQGFIPVAMVANEKEAAAFHIRGMKQLSKRRGKNDFFGADEAANKAGPIMLPHGRYGFEELGTKIQDIMLGKDSTDLAQQQVDLAEIGNKTQDKILKALENQKPGMALGR